MANDNQGSRTFLAIVLGGIVLALVIAAYFMYGNKGGTDVKVEQPAIEQPAPAPEPAPAPPAAEAPAPAPEPPAAEAPAPEVPAPEPAPEAPAPETPPNP